MGELIQTFHINAGLMIAQLVNFIIVLAVLWFFALKPLVQKMQERTDKIEKSLADAKRVEENLKRAEEIKGEKVAEARKEAQEIINKTNAMAEVNKRATIAKTKEEAAKIVAKAKEEIKVEQVQMMKEIKKEAGELVILAVEKIVGEKIGKGKEVGLVDEAIEAVK